jgi:hypothetical protein
MKYAIAIVGVVLFLGAPTQAKPPPLNASCTVLWR